MDVDETTMIWASLLKGMMIKGEDRDKGENKKEERIEGIIKIKRNRRRLRIGMCRERRDCKGKIELGIREVMRVEVDGITEEDENQEDSGMRTETRKTDFQHEMMRES